MMQILLKSNKSVIQSVVAAVIMLVCALLVWDQIKAIPVSEIVATFQSIAWWQWGLALSATWVSFVTIGYYDHVWHDVQNTSVSRPKARRTGMAAIALGQIIGVSAVTSAAVRWQMLPMLGVKTTTTISVGVGVSFLVCWACLGVIAAVGLAILPVVVFAGLAVAISLVTLGLPRYLPLTSQSILKLLSFTTIDVCFAGLAFWALIPEASLDLLPVVVLAYILALGAGLISNAPSGIGAFDLTLMTLLTVIPEANLLAAILAFRIVYHVIPAIGAVGLLVINMWRPSDIKAPVTLQPISDLVTQGARVRQVGPYRWVMRRHLFGQVALEPTVDRRSFTQIKAAPLGFLGLYKINRSAALMARRHGWAVKRIADDALLDPQTWTTDGSDKRQLRRKLSQAKKSGVEVTCSDTPLPWADMDRVAAQWAQNHDGELGYAMGRYDRTLVGCQNVYLIWHDGQLCGFVTVQSRATMWAIDLIRHLGGIPTGAIHAAFVQIIADAQTAGVAELSLGAVPSEAPFCQHQTKVRDSKTGLIQFKQSFSPQWDPRYHAAPTRLQWAVSMGHIVWHIQRPSQRLLAKIRRRLIIISPFFHLNPSRARDIAAAQRAHQRTNKGSPHDQYIRKPAG